MALLINGSIMENKYHLARKPNVFIAKSGASIDI